MFTSALTATTATLYGVWKTVIATIVHWWWLGIVLSSQGWDKVARDQRLFQGESMFLTPMPRETESSHLDVVVSIRVPQTSEHGCCRRMPVSTLATLAREVSPID